MRNTAITLHILEMVLAQDLLPECTWDCVEECVGWCREVVVDPAPLRRIGREWMERARGMRILVDALFVRSDPGKFCCGSEGVPLLLSSKLPALHPLRTDSPTKCELENPEILQGQPPGPSHKPLSANPGPSL